MSMSRAPRATHNHSSVERAPGSESVLTLAEVDSLVTVVVGTSVVGTSVVGTSVVGTSVVGTSVVVSVVNGDGVSVDAAVGASVVVVIVVIDELFILMQSVRFSQLHVESSITQLNNVELQSLPDEEPLPSPLLL